MAKAELRPRRSGLRVVKYRVHSRTSGVGLARGIATWQPSRASPESSSVANPQLRISASDLVDRFTCTRLVRFGLVQDR